MRMKVLSRTVVLLACFFIITSALPANACFSIIVGKNASQTGEVLLAHNEDNGGPLVMPQYKVPRMKHMPGEMLIMENSAAKIPQVPETWSYIWSETRIPAPGASFSDFFINEWGVAVTSDNCGPSREDKPELENGGVGFGIREIVAQRAKTAREGVEIAVELIEEYGYNASGRSYQIADKKEGWMLQIVNGKHYVAKRVADDEVALIPNHYTIRKVDMNDKQNYMVSPDLISYAISRGWYTPAVLGDYSDFDFAQVYQEPTRQNHPANSYRHQHSLELLLKKSIGQKDFPFSVKPEKKVGMDVIKEIVRTHYEGTADDVTNSYQISSPHFTSKRVICTSTTQQSFIVQFRDNPDFTVIWNALGHPCTSPYVPWYLGINKIPDGFGWIDAQKGIDSHFTAAVNDYSYNDKRAWWAIMDLQNIADPQYGQVIAKLKKSRDNLEKQYVKEQPVLEGKAQEIYKQSPEKGRTYLTQYTNKQAQLAVNTAKGLYNELNVVKIKILADKISQNDKQGRVSVVIYSTKDFDAAQIDASTLALGDAYRNYKTDWAYPLHTRLKDVDNDGHVDMIVSFNAADAAKYEKPRYADMWLTGKLASGKRFVARDFVEIVQ